MQTLNVFSKKHLEDLEIMLTFASESNLLIMCTVTLSYDNTNAQAREKLAALLASGMFEELFPEEEQDIDYNDPWLYEDHGDLPMMEDSKEYYTPEELREMLIGDLRDIYAVRNAV